MKKYIYIFILLLTLSISPKIVLADSLAVTSIDAVKTSATANNNFTDGWKWIFNITVPTGEDKLQMKFADWVNGSATIPAASNIRLYSAESINASTTGTAITVSAANTYSDELTLDPTKGQHIQVAVEIRVPSGTASGSYSTSYGVQTTGTTTPDTSVLSLRLTATSTATTTPISGDIYNLTHNLGVFGIKTATGTVSWITGLTFRIDNEEGFAPRSLIDYMRLSSPGASSEPEWLDDETITFHTSAARLSHDWVDFTLRTQTLATSTPFTLSATLIGTEIEAENNDGISLDVSGLSDITGNDLTFEAAPPATLEVSISSASPDAGNILVDENSLTDGVLLFKFKLKAEDSGITVSQITLNLTASSTSGTTTLPNIIDNLTLKHDAEEIANTATLEASDTQEIVIDLDTPLTINEGSTETVGVYVDIKSQSGNYNVGDSLKVDFVDAVAEDADTNEVDLTGSAEGEVQTLYLEEI